jgi:Tol biopolymer transport system component
VPIPEFQRLTFRRGYIAAARFSSDGHTILYSAAWQGGPQQIFSTQPEQPESRSLGYPDFALLSVSSLGEMAIKLPNGTLARVPLAGGAPRELLENVGDADWAPNGADLAVTRREGEKYKIEYPIGKTILESASVMTYPRVSRNGDWVAFRDQSVRGDDGAAVSVVDRAGRKKTLTRWWAWLEGVAWSPRGDEVWFTAADAGGAKVLYAVTLAGKLRVVLRGAGGVVLNDISRDGRVLLSRSDFRVEAHGSFAGDGSERDLSWLDQTTVTDLSPDGSVVLFADEGEGSGPHYTTYLRKTNGSPAVRLFEGLGMSLSPDGKWALAVATNRKPPLMVQPTGPGTPRMLETGPIETYDWASWFPDGTHIVVSGFDHGGLSRCYVQDLTGGIPQPITPPGTNLFNPGAAVSPDGRFVLVRHADASAYLYPVAGGVPRLVAGIPRNEYAIRWTPDGGSLYLAEVARGWVSRLDLATGRRSLWKAPQASDSAGMRLIAPVLISSDGRSCVYSLQRELSDLYLAKRLH